MKRLRKWDKLGYVFCSRSNRDRHWNREQCNLRIGEEVGGGRGREEGERGQERLKTSRLAERK